LILPEPGSERLTDIWLFHTLQIESQASLTFREKDGKIERGKKSFLLFL
jgi:hypothetical protein